MSEESSSARPGGAERASASFAGAVAPLLAVASMCSVQLGAALSRPATIEYGTVSTTWLRLCFAALALAIVVRPPLRTYSRQRWIAAVALGSAMAAMTLCFFAAVRRVPLGLAVAINFVGPLAVATFGVRKPAMLAWPRLALAGVLLLARQDGMWVASPAALIFPIGSALGWAAYILLMKRVGTLFDGLQGLSTSLIVAALVTTPFGLAQSGGHLPAGQLVDAAYLAVLVPLFPYVLELIALRRMSASAFGILMSAEPAIAAAIGFVVLAQPMGALQIAGTLCVVGASIGAVVQK
ncbi:EamA family transporter [Burkholderia stagnalis]|uniref:EamA family transporter n=1 Tax=Burkholderia stagnalis TaxID=1503054 RepID=UPI000F581EDE|nr:EamA family transporter [Burkholderia stagnalis]RQQ20484.1 EamA family transporter [Burkholderia stagnalis]RQQ22514.1 EamA family transporter [Burkholderia stagnalis]RQQ41343.1 EamA family transporter [Burkholderia stagnalis]RQX86712.1 EamA family transporter [Burkholderia stagnalis]RQY03364.1 EamA family transporter [Burkholderia stagnalis]